MIITFTYPHYLSLLALIPVLIVIHFWGLRSKRSYALTFANFESIARVRGVDFYSRNITSLILVSLTIALVAFAAAAPVVSTIRDSSAFSYAIALDTSQSMDAKDILPTRIDAAKETARNFINSAPIGTRIGIVSFAGNALIEQSLTDDRYVLSQVLDKISVGWVGGTDIREAVVTASNILDNEAAKVVIILSDGQMNVGTVEDAIQYASKKNVVVHTVALGTAEGGETAYGLSKVDEESLRAIAYSTNGKFFSASNRGDLAKIFEDIGALKTGPVSVDARAYLLMAAVFLVIIHYILINFRYRSIP